MTDDEFWAHVYPDHEDEGPSLIDMEDIVDLGFIATPCPECGQTTACAYDQEGRAMVHAITPDTEGEGR